MYTGAVLKREIFEFARESKELAKTLWIVGCECDLAYKHALAQEIGARFLVSECKGVETMGEIADFLTGKTKYDPRLR